MDNPALSAMFAQQAAPQGAAPQMPIPGMTEGMDPAQLLAQEQSLDPRLQGEKPAGSPSPEASPQEPEVADVLPQQRDSEEEDPTGERVLPKQKKKEEEKVPELNEMILVGLMGQTPEREKIKSPLKEINEEHLTRILMQGDNSAGVFTPTESSILEETKLKKLHEEIAQNAKITKTSEAKTIGKYETQFQEDILKNPQNYKLNTPRGEMSLQDCIRNGYHPDTNTFGESPKQMLERHIRGLDPREQEAIRNMVDTRNLSLDPKDVESRGIAASPEMLAQKAETPQEPTPAESLSPILPEGGNV